MEAEIEDFHIHLVTITYGETELSAGKSECWTVVLTMVRLIWREIRKVLMDLETEHGLEEKVVMAG